MNYKYVSVPNNSKRHFNKQRINGVYIISQSTRGNQKRSKHGYLMFIYSHYSYIALIIETFYTEIRIFKYWLGFSSMTMFSHPLITNHLYESKTWDKLQGNNHNTYIVSKQMQTNNLLFRESLRFPLNCRYVIFQ